MGKIHILDENTASKIAAGEVIERPSGVLKELLENAVDAGATSIRVDIEGSGKELIRINDNGCGMDADDLAASVLRHATSKIQTFNDLEQLHTFGFRGEALYSVAAVSKMTLTSSTGEGSGSRLEIHAGKVVAEMPAPAVKGTTIEIRDLFYNTPARLKFLKSDSYERACLLKVIEESALANLTVGYRVYINGREVYDLPAQTEPLPQAAVERARMILGQEVADSLIFKSFDKMGCKLFITPADKLVTVRDMQYVFVNRRPIDSKTIQQAVYKAYQNVRPKDRHPAFLVYLTLQPGEFDVNIHPQKRDIRFVNENQVFGFIVQAVGEAVFQQSRPVETSSFKTITLPPAAARATKEILEENAPASAQPSLHTPSVQDSLWKPSQEFVLRETEDPVPYQVRPEGEISSADEQKPETQKQPLYPLPAQPPASPQESSPQSGAPSWFEGPYHYLGQLQKSYLLFENPQGLILIDQHAAQERVLFEHYLAAFEKRAVKVQKLLFPLHVDLPPSNAQILLSWKDWLKTAGFELTSFSARTVLVHTRPHMIRFQEDELKEFIVSLSQMVGDPAKSTETLKRNMIAMLACKRAIKAHDQISAAEAEGLLENMKKCQDGMHCPHGRPCVAQVKMKDIDKLFGR